jgi:NhaA family Na+:H+ antiporter
LFGLVNGGVALGQIGAGTWIVAAALVVGKPLGIAAATFAASAVGARGRSALTPRDVVRSGALPVLDLPSPFSSPTAAFPDGDLLDQAKMGALFSLSAVPIAALAAMMLRVRRFARS